MNENRKTLSAWVAEGGYRWVDGHEVVTKGFITWVEAQALIEEYLAKGWLTRG